MGFADTPFTLGSYFIYKEINRTVYWRSWKFKNKNDNRDTVVLVSERVLHLQVDHGQRQAAEMRTSQENSGAYWEK